MTTKTDPTATLYGTLYAIAKQWATQAHSWSDDMNDRFADAYATLYAGCYSVPSPKSFAAANRAWIISFGPLGSLTR